MPTTTTVPSWTRGAAGNIRSSASLAASGTDNQNVNYDAVIGARVTVKNTPGGTVAATRGVRIDIYNRFGTTPTTSDSPFMSFTLPSATASTAETMTIELPPGQYNIKETNLDTANAVTVEVTGDTYTIQTS
jgi:hypothetical protein